MATAMLSRLSWCVGCCLRNAMTMLVVTLHSFSFPNKGSWLLQKLLLPRPAPPRPALLRLAPLCLAPPCPALPRPALPRLPILFWPLFIRSPRDIILHSALLAALQRLYFVSIFWQLLSPFLACQCLLSSPLSPPPSPPSPLPPPAPLLTPPPPGQWFLCMPPSRAENMVHQLQVANWGRGTYQPGLLGEGAPCFHGAMHSGSAFCPK